MLTINIDKSLKKQAETFFSGLGLDLETAVNMFIMQSLRQKRIPFVIGYENCCDEEDEDTYDAKIADKAYEEYVKDGCKSYPIEDLYKKYGVV
jgi:addiction module RelB/DinJ family antitoxin